MADTAKQSKYDSKRTAGLRPWKKGQSGNPKGRHKKEHTVTSLMADLLKQKADGTDKTFEMLLAEALVKGAIRSALKGNVAIAKEILERIEGKVTQPVVHGGIGGAPLQVETTQLRQALKHLPDETVEQAWREAEEIINNGAGKGETE